MFCNPSIDSPPKPTPPSKPCRCAHSWVASDHVDCRGKRQFGCPEKSCSGSEEPWCMIEDVDGCTGPETVGDDWMFCNPRTTEVAPREHCRCKKTWQDDVVCPGKTQYGCSKDCDDDPDAWCIVENPGCIEEEDKDGGGWAYCEIGGGLLQKRSLASLPTFAQAVRRRRKKCRFLKRWSML